MSRFLINASLLTMAAAFPALSFAEVSLTPADRQAMISVRTSLAEKAESNVADPYVDILMRCDSPETENRIEALGGKITGVYGDVRVVRVKAGDADRISSAKGVTSARVARKLRHANNNGRRASNVENVWAGRDLPQGYDGTDVVVGIYDTGLDPNHAHFSDNKGNSRVKALYVYPEASAEPAEYTTPEAIRAFRTDDSSQCHGTHVLGVMTGAFYPGAKDVDYRGMAPGADIVITTGQGYESQILDAVDRVGQYALSVGKPAVMNLSWGDNIGPHDGTDEFTAALNALAVQYDMVICTAAGNERDEDIAIVKQLTEEDNVLQTFIVAGTSNVPGANQGNGPIQVWTEDDTPFTVDLDIVDLSMTGQPLYTLTIGDGETKYVSTGSRINDYVDTEEEGVEIISSGTKFQKLYSQSFIGGKVGVSELNNRYCADLYGYLNARTTTAQSRDFIRVRITGQPGKRIFLYVADSRNMQLSNKNSNSHDRPDGNGTNSNMASGPETVSVGSYVSANISGSGYPSGVIGDISYFSSYGPTPDGRYVPDICAPGQVIVSSRNSHLGSSYYYSEYDTQTDPISGKKYSFTTMSGTSQACPNACGVAALVRQAAPSLDYTAIRQLMRDNASTPDSNSLGWGYGKVDAYNTVKAAVNSSSIAGNNADSRDILSRRNADGSWEITVPGADRFSVAIYSPDGTMIHEMPVAGSCATISNSIAPHGIYVIRILADGKSKAIKAMF